VALDKQYKAIKAPSSKFHKPFKQAAYRVSTGKKSKEERIAEETIHRENQRNASRLFEECVVLLAELKEMEILLRSSDDMVNPVAMMDKAEELHHAQREDKLKRYEEQASADREFQQQSLAALNDLRTEQEDVKEFRSQMLLLLQSLVDK